ncbi:YcdB/YcdC domain-containing protein [Methanoregula sp. PtaU1.Bin006]|uniref:YcdB/YcdC domain-containing protein n=2 Tax=unclassified Methanoregula TaxID=2649730 RepID=UPI0025DA071A|nr:YcdB/YcdC domain-containing protein [Methanoregula sp. PtaU1.Bin006]
MKNILLTVFSIIIVFTLVFCMGCSTTKVPDPSQDLSSPDPGGWKNTAPAILQTPEKSIRTFLGDPDAPVIFERNFTNSRGIDLGVYQAYGERFTVDAMTGSIIGISVISPDVKKTGPLSKDQAEAVALDYAMRHYPDFSSRNMQLAESGLIDHGDMGAEYSFLWSEQKSGINLGNYVGMSVDPNGKIMNYHEINKPVPAVRPAEVSKMAANATAVDHVISRTKIRNITAIESGSRLSVIDSNPATVAWIVDLEIRFLLPNGLEDHRGGNVYVDAMKGNVINYEPCM